MAVTAESMDILLAISDELALSVLQEWLQLKDLIWLNESYGSHASHPHFSRILKSGCYQFSHKATTIQTQCTSVTWLLANGVKVSNLAVPLVAPTEMYRKVFRQFFARNGSSIKELCVNHGEFIADVPETLIVECLVHCFNVTKLVLLVDFGWNETFLDIVNSSCPRLQSLHMTNFSPNGRYSLNSPDRLVFAELTALHVEDGILYTDVVTFLAKVMPHLESLSLKNASFETNAWPKLRHLDLHSTFVPDNVWPDLNQLASLRFVGSGKSNTINTVRNVANNCTNLTTLIFQSAYATTDDVRHLLQRCIKLTKLTLVVYDVADGVLQSVLAHSSELCELNIPLCALTETCLVTFAHNCSANLQRFTYSTGYIEWTTESADSVRKIFEQKGVVVFVI